MVCVSRLILITEKSTKILIDEKNKQTNWGENTNSKKQNKKITWETIKRYNVLLYFLWKIKI